MQRFFEFFYFDTQLRFQYRIFFVNFMLTFVFFVIENLASKLIGTFGRAL